MDLKFTELPANCQNKQVLCCTRRTHRKHRTHRKQTIEKYTLAAGKNKKDFLCTSHSAKIDKINKITTDQKGSLTFAGVDDHQHLLAGCRAVRGGHAADLLPVSAAVDHHPVRGAPVCHFLPNGSALEIFGRSGLKGRNRNI